MNLRTIVKILDYFRLGVEKEDFEIIDDNIRKGIEFRSTNLWILIFAIFIASLGLNVNSTAVIIGAMLISPLMGPIMGLGFGMAVNDLLMLKKSLFNYLFAAGTALLTSTLYFSLTPIDDAHSEILARTSPNIYDVLIALFGGLAGSLAASSRLKGNVVPGVAIATALMPPLCTAGYGLATFQFNYFFGAFYLFFINTVFIALATLITTRVLKFPYKQFPDRKHAIRAQRIVSFIVLLTLIPSLYLGYNLVAENRFMRNANNFIEAEGAIPDDYLLQKNIDPKSKEILLVYGGSPISAEKITDMRNRLSRYSLTDTKLEVKQGFASIINKDNPELTKTNQSLLLQKENQLRLLEMKMDSLSAQHEIAKQIFQELKALNEHITALSLQKGTRISDSTAEATWLAWVSAEKIIPEKEKKMIRSWMEKRIHTDQIQMAFDEKK